MSFYSEMAGVAEELITEFGQLMTFSRGQLGAYDPSTGQTGAGTQISWTGYVVVQQASKGTNESFDIRLEGNTLIESNLRSLIISANMERAPAPGDTVNFEGSDWTLLGVTPLNPAGLPMIYTATARR